MCVGGGGVDIPMHPCSKRLLEETCLVKKYVTVLHFFNFESTGPSSYVYHGHVSAVFVRYSEALLQGDLPLPTKMFTRSPTFTYLKSTIESSEKDVNKIKTIQSIQ